MLLYEICKGITLVVCGRIILCRVINDRCRLRLAYGGGEFTFLGFENSRNSGLLLLALGGGGEFSHSSVGGAGVAHLRIIGAACAELSRFGALCGLLGLVYGESNGFFLLAGSDGFALFLAEVNVLLLAGELAAVVDGFCLGCAALDDPALSFFKGCVSARSLQILLGDIVNALGEGGVLGLALFKDSLGGGLACQILGHRKGKGIEILCENAFSTLIKAEAVLLGGAYFLACRKDLLGSVFVKLGGFCGSGDAVSSIDDMLSVRCVFGDIGIVDHKIVEDLLGALATLHLLGFLLADSTLVINLVVQSGIGFYRLVGSCFLDSKLADLQLLHAVVHVEEFVLGKLCALQLVLSFNLVLLRVFDGAEDLLDSSLYESAESDDAAQNGQEHLGNGSFTLGEEIGHVDRKYREGDNDQTHRSEDLYDSVCNDASD